MYKITRTTIHSFYLLSFLAFIVLSTISCQSNNDDDMEDFSSDNNLTFLLKKVYQDGRLEEERFYNSDSMLIRKIVYQADTVLFINEYEYIEDTIKATFKDYLDEVNLIQYNFPLDGDSYRIVLYEANGDINTTSVYHTLDDCGISNEQLVAEGNIFLYNATYEYTDANCSFKYERRDFFANPLGEVTIKRDGKEIPYFFPLNNLWGYDKQHGSVIQRLAKDENLEINESTSYNASIEYNEYDYPISEQRVYLDGNVINLSFEY